MICSGHDDITFIRYDNHTDMSGPTAPAAAAPMIKVKMNTSFKAPRALRTRPDEDKSSIMTMEPEDCEEEEVLSIYNVPITTEKVENDYDEVTREEIDVKDDEEVLANFIEPIDMVQQTNKGKVTPDSNFDSLAGKSITTTMVEKEMEDEELIKENNYDEDTSSALLETNHSSQEEDDERSLEEISSNSFSLVLSTKSSEHYCLDPTTTNIVTSSCGQSSLVTSPPGCLEQLQEQVCLDLSVSLKGKRTPSRCFVFRFQDRTQSFDWSS